MSNVCVLSMKFVVYSAQLLAKSRGMPFPTWMHCHFVIWESGERDGRAFPGAKPELQLQLSRRTVQYTKRRKLTANGMMLRPTPIVKKPCLMCTSANRLGDSRVNVILGLREGGR